MKSNDSPWLGWREIGGGRVETRWTVMKMEAARPEPSCGTTEASAAVSGFQHWGLEKKGGGLETSEKLIGWS